MLEFKINIDRSIHDCFVKGSKYCNLLQSAAWADVKSNWQHTRVGVFKEDSLVCAALVLIKPLPLGLTMMYIPRGPVMDYNDDNLLHFFFIELKKWAKTKKCLYITFDPAIVLRSFTMQEKDKEYDEKALKIIKVIEDNGIIFKGFSKNIMDTIQPRFHMGVEYTENLDQHVQRSTVRSKNVAIRKHVKVKRVGIEGLDEFSRIMHLTEERKNVHLRNKEYYEHLMKTYGDDAYLFLASVNPKDRENELLEIINNCKNQLEDENLGNKARRKYTEELNTALKEKESMQDILKICQEERVIAGGLMIGYGDCVEMLYAGMDGAFYSFRPQYLTYMTQFEYAFSQGYRFVSMGGVEGTLDDGLSVYKSNFNPQVIEHVGEFDLPVNKMLYGISQYMFKLRKKINLRKK